MAVIEIAKIQVRRGQETVGAVPQLAPGEFGWAQDTENLYIGKRISEGANTDENSRILSQKDYDNLFAIVMGAGRTAVASTSTYRYRDDISYSDLASTTTFIGKKLDAFVSLTDFGVTASSSATNIYTQLVLAIENLFSNNYLGNDTVRNLLIPAGIYYVSDTVDLPPNTRLIGEGRGATTLLSQNNDRPIFRTIYSDGANFNSPTLQSQLNPKNILIKNLTLAYSTSTSTAQPLVLVDNAENSVIDNVEFTVKLVATSTNTVTVLSTTTSIYGTGISLRGKLASGIEQNKNVQITNCLFQNIGTAVIGTGTVAYTQIDHNKFADLQNGIKFTAFSNDNSRLAPKNSLISQNYFERIYYAGIYIGTSTNQVTQQPNQLNHTSMNNNFYYVGNAGQGDFVTVNTGTAIITNLGEGFTSSNDSFSRQDKAHLELNRNTMFYRPLVDGKVFLDGGSNYLCPAISFGTNKIHKLFVGRQNLSYRIPYTMTDGAGNYTRSGSLTVNVNANPNYSTPSGSVSDYYDFSYEDPSALTDPNYLDDYGEFNHPVISLDTDNNNSYINLVSSWPVSAATGTTLVATVSTITNANPAVVQTTLAHGLSSGTQIILNGVSGMSGGGFSLANYQDYYAWVISTNTFALYWNWAAIDADKVPLDTTSLTAFSTASTATVVLPSSSVSFSMQYQINVVSL